MLSLLWEDVRLETERPYLLVRASTTKNKKEAVVPLHARLVEAFRAEKDDCRGRGTVFPLYGQPDRRIRRHMKKAGLQRFDRAGRKLDFQPETEQLPSCRLWTG